MLTLTEGEKIVLRVLWNLVHNTRGGVCSLTTTRMLRLANAKVSPFNAMIIRYVLDRLVREGHLKVEKRMRCNRYYLRRRSRLWRRLEELPSPPERLVDVLSRLGGS